MENKNDVIRKLRSVGINTFIKYYNEFERKLDRKDLLEIFRKNSEKWKDSAANTKASIGKWFFRTDNNVKALEYIVYEANENAIGIDTKAKAEAILDAIKNKK